MRKKIHRFIGNFDFGHPTILDGEISHQIKNVLHLKAGEQLILANGIGEEAIGQIVSMDKNVQVKILDRRRNQNEPVLKVCLYGAILKRENFEWVAQKATEVGVSEIVPLITQRTVKMGLKMGRLRQIMKEAAEQAGRGQVPVLHEPMKFETALDEAARNQKNFLCDLSGQRFDASGFTFQEQARAGIFIGPEGGWEEVEIGTAKEHGFEIVSLGALTLRAETAAVIAAYLTSHAS